MVLVRISRTGLRSAARLQSSIDLPMVVLITEYVETLDNIILLFGLENSQRSDAMSRTQRIHVDAYFTFRFLHGILGSVPEGSLGQIAAPSGFHRSRVDTYLM